MGYTDQVHHEATDGLLKLLTKANHDLTLVQQRLEKEFQQVYPDNANPMKLVSRIKKIQEDLSALKEQCHELLSAKQGLIDGARTLLVGNRSLLQRMQSSMEVPLTDDAGDSAFDYFNQVSTAETSCCYLEIGGSPSHLARNPVPLQSEQRIDPWKNHMQGIQ
ncbi:hypothetical protein L484_007137 [Morus notabilis]|uniref:Protein FAM33A n=1 Tax=Morus notabilis TaxID=981085 RepID=W9RZC1_9ROSA|nr:hypothetical protein L484_007137 [Morus notabilis]